MAVQRFLSGNNLIIKLTNNKTNTLRTLCVMYPVLYKHTMAFEYKKLWHLICTKVNMLCLEAFLFFEVWCYLGIFRLLYSWDSQVCLCLVFWLTLPWNFLSVFIFSDKQLFLKIKSQLYSCSLNLVTQLLWVGG